MTNITGYIAIILIQAATIPAILKALQSPESIPFLMPLMLATGCLLLLIRAIQEKDTVYIVSNTIGFLINILLLSVCIL